MKKTSWMTTALVCSALMISPAVPVIAALAAAPAPVVESVHMPIKLLYNARQLATDVASENVNGTVLVPIRFVSDKLGAKLTLQGKKITIVKPGKKLELTIGASTATVNGVTMKLAVPVQVKTGRTLVPLRVISEGLGTPVEWDANLRFVWIGNKEVPTLEEVVKGKVVSAEPFLKKYPNIKYYLDDYYDQSHLALLDSSDFPFVVEKEYHYRLDLAFISGVQYIQSSTTDKGTLLTAYYYLTLSRTMPVRYRGAYYRVIKNELRINYYPIPSGQDFDKIGANYKFLTYKDIEYVGMNLPGDRAIIVKNPLRW